MPTPARFAEIASLAGDPARAAMLHALMDGRALTAGELARAAGVTPQTASGHLSRLATAGLVAVTRQGRHRYHRLAAPAVATMLESIMQVAAVVPQPARNVTTGPKDAALRAARTCYDHLAGRLGVAIADALVGAGHIELSDDGGLVTGSGIDVLARLGLDRTMLEAGPAHGSSQGTPRGRRIARVLCRPCLDWSERRPHIAGRLGAALCTLAFDSGWIRRIDASRAVSVTRKGEAEMRSRLGIVVN